MTRSVARRLGFLSAILLLLGTLSACGGGTHYTDCEPQPPHWAPVLGPFDTTP
jgi:hypothetical protein